MAQYKLEAIKFEFSNGKIMWQFMDSFAPKYRITVIKNDAAIWSNRSYLAPITNNAWKLFEKHIND